MSCICEGKKWIIPEDWPIGEPVFVFPCECIGGPNALMKACSGKFKDWGTIKTWKGWSRVSPEMFKQHGYRLAQNARIRAKALNKRS